MFGSTATRRWCSIKPFTRARQSILLGGFALLLLCSSCRTVAPIAESVDDLQLREERGQAAIALATPAVILLDSIRHGHLGSAVLISEDGIFMTAAHVLKNAGSVFLVKTPDGRTASAEAIWADTKSDIGLGRITTAGRWPHINIRLDPKPWHGEWVISLGFPDGISNGRVPAARTGRVRQSPGMFGKPWFVITDSATFKGDSGGALIDLNGDLIGVHSWSIHSPASNASASMTHVESALRILLETQDPKEQVARLRDLKGNLFGGTRFYTRMMLSGTKEYFSLSKVPFVGSHLDWHLRPDQDHARHHVSVLEAFTSSISKAAESTVELRGRSKQLAYGTIVHPNGLIISKASELKGLKAAVLPNGKRLAAKVVDVNEAYDIALVKINARGLVPIEWNPSQQLVSGSLLATPGSELALYPVSHGMLSKPAALTQAKDKIPATQLILRTKGSVEGIILEEFKPKAAADAIGLKAGDLITRVNRKPMESEDQLVNVLLEMLRSKKGMPAELIRDGEAIRLRLGRFSSPPSQMMMGLDRFFAGWLRGDVNKRRRDFPATLQHDLMLKTNELGGPLVAINGGVIGVNIARASREKTYAIPAEEIIRLLQDLENHVLSTP